MDIEQVISELCGKQDDNKLPIEVIQRTSLEAGQTVMTLWANLNAIILRHEVKIRERWRKKTVNKRQHFLLQVSPSIPILHPPDLRASRPQNHTEQAKRSKLWPYVNIEDLCDNLSLLVFLNARGRNHPSTFAHSELDFSDIQDSSTSLDTEFDQMQMSLREFPLGQGNAKVSYGSITYPATKKFAGNPGPGGIVCSPRMGLQILRLQMGIMRFLLRCCETILDDIDPNDLCNSVYPVAPDVPRLMACDKRSYDFTTATRLAPYLNHTNLDISRIQNLATTLRDIAKDHAWALREDPNYFSENFRACKDHQYENILDKEGRTCESLGSRNFNSRVLTQVVEDTYCGLLMWDSIFEATIALKPFSAYISTACPQELPQDYADAVCLLYFFLREERDQLGRQIEKLSVASPELRHLARRTKLASSIDIELAFFEAEDAEEDYVSSLLLSLGEKGVKNHLTHIRLDRLETYVRRSLSTKRLISPLIQQKLSCLFMLVECLQQLRITARHSTMIPKFDDLETNIPGIPAALALAKSIRKYFGRDLDHVGKVIAPHLGNPEDGKFDYPDEDTQSARTVNQRRRAENNLDKFWIHVDKGLLRIGGFSQHPRVRKYLQEGGSMRRTAPWQAPADGQVAEDTCGYIYHPLSEVFHDPAKDITGNFDKLSMTSKTKEKTRGTQTFVRAAQDQGLVRPPISTAKPVYRVDNDTYMVLKVLFHTTNDGELPRNIRWADVVNALTKLGFSAEKLHGSAWQFTPTKFGLKRGIQFHEPHPDDEVPLWLARRYGRRLNRAYDWDGSMFKRK